MSAIQAPYETWSPALVVFRILLIKRGRDWNGSACSCATSPSSRPRSDAISGGRAPRRAGREPKGKEPMHRAGRRRLAAPALRPAVCNLPLGLVRQFLAAVDETKQIVANH